jgi:hypothetical protein
VVPSHLTLAALAYYQPRFASQKARGAAPPLFVLDRLRTAPYTEASDRFDNRYYARLPSLPSLAAGGVRTVLYVVASAAALPEPDDLNLVLAASTDDPPVSVSALAVTDFRSEKEEEPQGAVFFGGSPRREATFWPSRAPGALTADDFAPAPAGGRPPETKDHAFVPRRGAATVAPPDFGTVPVVVTASGLILSAALDRSGSMNRFAGGWSG